jgi:hypothetical protein
MDTALMIVGAAQGDQQFGLEIAAIGTATQQVMELHGTGVVASVPGYGTTQLMGGAHAACLSRRR